MVATTLRPGISCLAMQRGDIALDWESLLVTDCAQGSASPTYVFVRTWSGGPLIARDPPHESRLVGTRSDREWLRVYGREVSGRWWEVVGEQCLRPQKGGFRRMYPSWTIPSVPRRYYSCHSATAWIRRWEAVGGRWRVSEH